MAGVFVKLSEIFRYLDGDENLNNLIKGEPHYYNQLLFCSAITSRTEDKIKLFCLMDSEEDMRRDAEPSPVEISGTLNISRTGEFLIDEFKCLPCNASKCQHVAAQLIFLNRHNINKFERIKSEEVAKSREMIINSRYNPKLLSEFFKTKQGDDEEDEKMGSDESFEEIEEEAQQIFLENLIKHLPDSELTDLLRAKLAAHAEMLKPTSDNQQPSTSGNTAKEKVAVSSVKKNTKK